MAVYVVGSEHKGGAESLQSFANLNCNAKS